MSRLRYKITVIALNFLMLPLWISNTFGQDVKSSIYTLESSISTALANNLSLKAKEEKIRETEYAKEKAKADFYPNALTKI